MRKKSKQMITRFSRTEIWLYLSHVRLNGAERYRRNRRFSVNKGLLKFSQNSQENYCATVSYLIKFQA